MKTIKTLFCISLLSAVCLLGSCQTVNKKDTASNQNVILVPNMETGLLLSGKADEELYLIDCDEETDSRVGKQFNREDAPQTYSLTFDDRIVTGIYRYSLRHSYYQSDIDIYDLPQEDGGGIFVINIPKNLVVCYCLDVDRNEELETRLSQEELLRVAEGELAKCDSQSESYVLKDSHWIHENSIRICLEKHVSNFPTYCSAVFEIRADGKVINFEGFLMPSMLESPNISVDTQTRDQMIHDKMQTILAEKFDQIQYEIKDTYLIRERDGSYSIEYVIKITETNSEKPKTGHIWLLMHLKEAT